MESNIEEETTETVVTETPAKQEDEISPNFTGPTVVADLSKSTTNLVTDLKDLGISEDTTIGIVASPTALIDLLNLVSLPGEKNTFEYPKIVLNFAEKLIWWHHKSIGKAFTNAGMITRENYFDKVWGSGTFGINAKKLALHLNFLRGYKELTFWVDLKTKTYGIQAANIDKFTGFLESVEDIATAQKVLPNFNDEGELVQKDTGKGFPYAITVETTELAALVERGKIFAKAYPLIINNEGIHIEFGDMMTPGASGANSKKLVPKPDKTYRIPTGNEEARPVLGEKIETIPRNIKGDVTLFFTEGKKTPMYVRKVQETELDGKMLAVMIMQTNVMRTAK